MNQRTFFDCPELPPHQRHSDTSRDAAEQILPTAGTLRAAVLALIEGSADGYTDEEMQSLLQMNPSTQRPRRVELQKAGLIVDSGSKRPTRSGRQATVWRVR